jgi:hypothetical protein
MQSTFAPLNSLAIYPKFGYLKLLYTHHGQQNETPYVSYLCLAQIQILTNGCSEGKKIV